MQQIINSQEHKSRRFYLELKEHLISDARPSKYLNQIYSDPIFRQSPFILLYNLKETEQSLRYHPEGNVWNHTMLVVDEAAKRKDRSKDPNVFMWAALLHDIGKGVTTKKRKGKITSYDHDKAGAKLAETFLTQLHIDQGAIRKICSLVRYHMQVLYVVNRLRFADIKNMKQDADIDEIALLGLCDRLGRGNSDQKKEEDHIRQFLKICKTNEQRR